MRCMHLFCMLSYKPNKIFNALDVSPWCEFILWTLIRHKDIFSGQQYKLIHAYGKYHLAMLHRGCS